MGLEEILQLRQRPTAYMLLAYLRERHGEGARFRVQPAKLARELGRTRGTIHTAFLTLLDLGYVAKAQGFGRLYEFSECFTRNKQSKNRALCDVAETINPAL